MDTDFPAEDKFSRLPAAPPDAIRRRGVAAFVTVQEGCDKFCSFCVVPYTRGAEASRPVAPSSTRSRASPSAGVREVTLIGQNVNAYHGLDAHGRAIGLAGLIRAAAAVPGIARVRYTTSHPNDMSEDLIDAHRDIPALAPYLHLPVQSGSDAVLTSMNRRHRVADYLDIVARVRAARPDIALSSDFIVGYPGETDADFEADARARSARSASPRPTPSNIRPGPERPPPRCPTRSTKRRRLGASLTLQALIEDAAAGLQPGDDRTARRGSVREAGPARGPGRRTVAPYAGRCSPKGRRSLIGALANVEILAAEPHSLRGRIVATAS